MRKVKHILIDCEEAFESLVQEQAYYKAFEWANKAGRSGRMVGDLWREKKGNHTLLSCIEILTDEDYHRLLKSKQIQEPLKAEMPGKGPLRPDLADAEEKSNVNEPDDEATNAHAIRDTQETDSISGGPGDKATEEIPGRDGMVEEGKGSNNKGEETHE